MTTRLALALLLAAAARGAEFFSGQAARAVLGQSSFSSRDAGIAASAMTIQSNRLNVADRSGRVSVFDLAKIPGARAELQGRGSDPCSLCGLPPVLSVSQSVAAESSTVSLFGNRLAAIDIRTHRILIWYDIRAARSSAGPDVTLSLTDPGVLAVNDSTIIDPVSVAVDGSRLFVGDAALHRILVWKSLPVAGNQPADAVLGQPDFASRDLSDVPRANTIARPDALVSDGVNLFVGDSRDRRVLIFSAADTYLPSASVLNAASMLPGSFAPGTLVTIKGQELSAQALSAPDDQPSRLPTKLGGAQVYVNGLALALLSVAQTEIHAQLPYTIPAGGSGSLYVRSEYPDGSVAVTSPASVSFSTATPGIFAFGGNEPRPGILLHTNGAQDSGSPVTADAPAAAGEVVSLWVTGLHPVTSSSEQMPVAGAPYMGSDLTFTPLRAVVNGQDAEVVSASLPSTSIGVYQVLVLLPPNLTREKAELSIGEDGYNSNAITFPVRERAPHRF